MVTEVHIDSLKLVRDRQTLAGVLPVAGFSRLKESLHDAGGVLAYRAEGTVDRHERPLLRLRVTGTVQLQCQRCLEGFDFAVEVESAVRLVAADALDREYDDDPDEPDCVATSTEFDLAALIEDEVLLALPAYPRHAQQAAGQCNARRIETATGAGLAEAGAAPGAKITAFSALQALKQKGIPSKE